MNLEAITEVLNRDDVRSRVMKDAAFFDAFIGFAIGIYFSTPERAPDFYNLILERLSLEERIRVLREAAVQEVV